MPPEAPSAPGSPLFFDGSWVVSAGERPGFRPFGFFVVSKTMANKLQNVGQSGIQIGPKILENPSWDCFFHFPELFHFRRHGFSFIMLSGRIGSFKIQRKPCRVSQNRGFAVFHKIHDFSEKLLKMSPPISPKVTESTKYLYPGPSENTPTFQGQFLSFLVSF